MMKLSDLINKTPAPVRGRSTVVDAKLVQPSEVVITDEGEYLVGIWETRTPLADQTNAIKGGRYTTELWLSVPVSGMSKVHCSCSCPYWKYYMEVAVSKKKSTEVQYSNGAPPVVRNPEETPGLCKHLYRVALLTLKKAQEVNTKNKKSLMRDL